MSETSLKDKADDRYDEDVLEKEPEPSAADEVAASAADPGKRITVSVRSLSYSVVVALLVVAVGVLAWLYIGAQKSLNAQAATAENEQRAKDVALEYAVNAAQMDFRDFAAWKVRLVDNTTPELKEKLDRAATDMEQVLAPLQWESTARPLAAAVRSEAAGIYVVDTFVSVVTKTMQAPEGMQSTATYGITIDSNNDWQISDVGGIDAVLGSN